MIHSFKYQNKTSLRHTFARLIFSFIRNYALAMDQFDIIVPIPLHPTRLRERGYNQSQLLSENISKEFNIRHSPLNLMRIRNTRNQALLKEKERWTNIQGAFKIKDPLEFFAKSVLIVDDLLTTGATASEVARILKEAGAQKVSVLTLAIAH